LAEGELLCIMRTGYTHDPMYVCRSRDDGRTWSKPVSTGLRGVDPRLLLLSNGLVACAYGVKEYEGNRRERRLMFSNDAGRTWSQNTIVFAGYGGSYPDAVEVEPGKILYVYDADGFKEPGQTTRPRNYLRLAAVSLNDGHPFLLVRHEGKPDAGTEIISSTTAPSRDLSSELTRLLHALRVGPGHVVWTHPQITLASDRSPRRSSSRSALARDKSVARKSGVRVTGARAGATRKKRPRSR